MRAAVLRQTGDENLEIRDDVEVVGPGAGEVKVRIAATGVCHSDLSGMTGVIPQPAPAVLGHEGAGIIAEVGEGVTTVKEGDHVIVAWSPPCGICTSCVANKSPHLCSAIQINAIMTPRFRLDGEPIFGFAGTGTFAEEIVLPQQAVVPIDPTVPLEIASLIGCGGVGISAIQGARIAGAAEIVAVDLLESKLDDAKRLGATHGTTPDGLASLSQEITEGVGFDYAFEAIGNPVTMRAAYDAVRRGGTATIIGVGKADAMVSFSAFELFYSEKRLVGSYYGSADVRSDFHRLLRLWRAGKLDLEGMISRKIDIGEINDAFATMRRGEMIRQVVQFENVREVVQS